jgi:hypothetical protein
MKTNSQHIPFATLADLAEKQTAPDVRTESMTHLSTCGRCGNEFRRLEQLIQTMRSDLDTDAPRDLLAYAVNLFGQSRQSAAPSMLRRVIAALSFDSATSLAPAFGVRSGSAPSRQLVYSAESNDIDLRITPQGDRWVVTGQVLGNDCAGTEITLKGETESTSVELNELCEFTLPPVLPGKYVLVLRIADLEVEIPEVELRA